MKKLVFLTLIVVLTLQSFAQENNKKYNFPSFGVRVGYNYTILWESVAVDEKWKSSANFGIIADFPFKNNWIIRPGIYFTGKGFKMRVQDIEYHKHNFNYLEVPLLAVYQKSIGEKCSFEFQVGPYFSYGIFGKLGCGYFYNYELCLETFEHYKRFDWGANAGLGINISNIYIGAAYDFGFVSIMDHALHNCLMANLGYNF